MPFRVPLERQGFRDLRRRAAEVRDPQAALSQAALPHPRRADLGAHARRSRRGAGHAARHGGEGRPHHPDDHAQVPRGHGLCRRGDDPAPRPAGRAGPGQGTQPRRHGAHDDRRRGAHRAAGAHRRVRRAAARHREAQRARRWRPAGGARRVAVDPRRRDRRRRRRVRQRTAPARSRCSPASARPRAATSICKANDYHATRAGDARGTTCRCCRRSR